MVRSQILVSTVVFAETSRTDSMSGTASGSSAIMAAATGGSAVIRIVAGVRVSMILLTSPPFL